MGLFHWSGAIPLQSVRPLYRINVGQRYGETESQDYTHQMGLLDHTDEKPCPHPDCTGKLIIVKSNVSGGVKEIRHED
jgi:hypothetical protein